MAEKMLTVQEAFSMHDEYVPSSLENYLDKLVTKNDEDVKEYFMFNSDGLAMVDGRCFGISKLTSERNLLNVAISETGNIYSDATGASGYLANYCEWEVRLEFRFMDGEGNDSITDLYFPQFVTDGGVSMNYSAVRNGYYFMQGSGINGTTRRVETLNDLYESVNSAQMSSGSYIITPPVNFTRLTPVILLNRLATNEDLSGKTLTFTLTLEDTGASIKESQQLSTTINLSDIPRNESATSTGDYTSYSLGSLDLTVPYGVITYENTVRALLNMSFSG